jgi:dihydrofolate reductase
MLAIIAAKSNNNVIGFEGKMPWKQRNDLQRFKALTYGHTCIMGRKTLQSMGKPLPNRTNIVLTNHIVPFLMAYQMEYPESKTQNSIGMTVMSNLEEACKKFYKMEFPNHMYLPTGFIIGGQSLYEAGMSKAQMLYITEIDCDVKGDAFFPEIDPTIWIKVAEEKYKADVDNQYDYKFVTYAHVVKPIVWENSAS